MITESFQTQLALNRFAVSKNKKVLREMLGVMDDMKCDIDACEFTYGGASLWVFVVFERSDADSLWEFVFPYLQKVMFLVK